MYKETIKYTDYDGNERTEDFYFNLSKAEFFEMEASATGGFEKMVQSIIDADDHKRLVELFKEIIAKAYGKKSVDGRKFVKNAEILEDFTQTEAYSILFMKLARDADAAAAFVNGIAPTGGAQVAGQMELSK